MTFTYRIDNAYVIGNSIRAMILLAGTQIFTEPAIQTVCFVITVVYTIYIGLMNFRLTIQEKFQFHIDKFALSVRYKKATKKILWFSITKVEEENDGLAFYTDDKRVERFVIFNTLTDYRAFKDAVLERAAQHNIQFEAKEGSA